MLPTIDLNRIRPRRDPLSLAELRHLYDLTGWRVVILDERIRQRYNEFSTLSIIKMLALPFLLNIPSERALYRQLKEREPLQTLCGYTPGEKLPTRGTLGNFRRFNKEAFPDLMRKVLISMVLSDKIPNLNLPFVIPIPEQVAFPEEQSLRITLEGQASPIDIWITINPGSETIKSEMRCTRDFQEYRRLADEYKRVKKSHSLAYDLGLPMQVKTHLGEHLVCFYITQPDWLDTQTRQKDTLTGVGPSSFKPYSACNVLVIRTRRGKPQILLGRRKSGQGKGMYALPVGKCQENESLSACAHREVLEETGLRLINSKPVSLHIKSPPGRAMVYSVGVLAERYSGIPRTIEESQHEEWQWFDLEQLPAPLFEPAKIAITQYLENKYPNLEWSDVEAHIAEGGKVIEQLSFFGEEGSANHRGDFSSTEDNG